MKINHTMLEKLLKETARKRETEELLNMPDQDLVYDRPSANNQEEVLSNLRGHTKVWENHEAFTIYQDLLNMVNFAPAEKIKMICNDFELQEFSKKSVYTEKDVIKMTVRIQALLV